MQTQFPIRDNFSYPISWPQPSTILYPTDFCGSSFFAVAFLLLLNAKFMNNFQKESRVKCTTRTHATFPGAERMGGYLHLEEISKGPEDVVDDFVNAFGPKKQPESLAHNPVGLLYCAL